MSDLLPESIPQAVVYSVLGLLLLALLLLAYRRFYRPARTLKSVIRTIAYDRLSNLVIPKADEGEILIDHLLLTAGGLLVLDLKEVQGIVFGSDKMQDWTVIGEERRYTFSNPQPALYDRIAAVRQIVRDVPVSGRVLFLDGADFQKGVPDLVCNLDDLLDEFGDADQTGAAARIDAFKPHWERIRQAATQGGKSNAAGRVAGS
ncbi:MAG: nuclease-related domain-containing protein [Woeseia sp.]